MAMVTVLYLLANVAYVCLSLTLILKLEPNINLHFSLLQSQRINLSALTLPLRPLFFKMFLVIQLQQRLFQRLCPFQPSVTSSELHIQFVSGKNIKLKVVTLKLIDFYHSSCHSRTCKGRRHAFRQYCHGESAIPDSHIRPGYSSRCDCAICLCTPCRGRIQLHCRLIFVSDYVPSHRHHRRTYKATIHR